MSAFEWVECMFRQCELSSNDLLDLHVIGSSNRETDPPPRKTPSHRKRPPPSPKPCSEAGIARSKSPKHPKRGAPPLFGASDPRPKGFDHLRLGHWIARPALRLRPGVPVVVGRASFILFLCVCVFFLFRRWPLLLVASIAPGSKARSP